ncbi:hypothetical protein C8J57DRAFT_1242353 [Mycena rebaudengoi]|nr:hypothetical protein C8J57DRAFT_1242353 [Mycena rebaudengoi]
MPLPVWPRCLHGTVHGIAQFNTLAFPGAGQQSNSKDILTGSQDSSGCVVVEVPGPLARGSGLTSACRAAQRHKPPVDNRIPAGKGKWCAGSSRKTPGASVED